MRVPIASLDGAAFDVVIIGGGINGTAAAHELSASGYSVLLVEKDDFGSGSSSRSSRLLHCGLRYLEPTGSLFDFVRRPSLLKTALRMARKAMQARSRLAKELPERVRPMQFCFPIYRSGPYPPWQTDVAFTALKMMGEGGVPLDYRRLSPAQARTTPLLRSLRDFDQLLGVAVWREYRIDWPERLCIDYALEAERCGAVFRNYTAAGRLAALPGARWQIELIDRFDESGRASVQAKVVLNTSGIWIDRVSTRANARARRRILGTKGVHIMVRLPEDCRDIGIATLNRDNEPFYCVPWRATHYLGPTETVYEGDIDDIVPLEEEVESIIAEANRLLPSLALRRHDVLFAWAGVRPLTYDPSLPKGKRSREIHDYSGEGMPNFLSLTAGPVMTHRSAAEELAAAVRTRISPSRSVQACEAISKVRTPAVLVRADGAIEPETSELLRSVANEQVESLEDLLWRRAGLVWNSDMAYEQCRGIAQRIAPAMHWDARRTETEIDAFQAMLRRRFLYDPSRSHAQDVLSA